MAANASAIKVLNPREGQRGEALQTLLCQAEYDSLALPLFEIKPSSIAASNPFEQFGNQLISAANTAAVTLIFTSVYAVEYALLALKTQAIDTAIIDQIQQHKVFAIGAATAEALAKIGFEKIVTPLTATSEGLLQLAEFNPQHPQGLSSSTGVAIIKGQHGRNKIEEKLTNLGYFVETYSLYQRCWLNLTNAQLSRILKLDAWLITSGEMLAHLTAQLLVFNKEAAVALFTRVHLFLPSNRIVEQAKTLGYRQITNCNSANNAQLLLALNQAYRSRETND